jgi:hypothetical protein
MMRIKSKELFGVTQDGSSRVTPIRHRRGLGGASHVSEQRLRMAKVIHIGVLGPSLRFLYVPRVDVCSQIQPCRVLF